MDIEEARELLKRYNAGECTEAESALIESSFLEYNEHGIDVPQERIDEIGHQIYAELPIQNSGAKPVNPWMGIAAIAAMIVLTIGTWHLAERYIIKPSIWTAEDIRPGSNKATILLSNGKIIDLDGAKSGIVIKGDKLAYTDNTTLDINDGLSTAIQTLATPNGGQYHIILSDGTKVWLNAASSLTYPSSFTTTNRREVKLVGEAYFEVAPDKSKPFIVKSSMQTVEVLGTHFNINGYNDAGHTITTLVEGAVKVANQTSTQALLRPNEQSILSAKNIMVQEADIKTALAWKNGKIAFRDANIQSIMKQISRWYDIDVEYRGDIPDRIFNGSISRSANLSVLLKILAFSNIHFTIEQDRDSRKKLIVTP